MQSTLLYNKTNYSVAPTFPEENSSKTIFLYWKTYIHNLFKILNKTQHYTYSGSIYFVPKHFPSEGQYYNKCLKEICTTGF